MNIHTSGDVTVRVIEQDCRRVPLGIRFWDPVLNATVTENLQVWAIPLAGRAADRRPLAGRRTPSGIFAFHSLPGLGGYERKVADPVTSPAAPDRHRFVILTADRGNDYLPIAFEVELPLDELGPLIGARVTSPDSWVPGVLMMSAPSRRVPPWLAAVRGTLLRADTEAPAAHALVVVIDPRGKRWRGIADAEGRFTVLLGYPEPASSTSGSPPRIAVGALPQQAWNITLEIQHDPALPLLPGVELPDYRDILAQPLIAVAQDEQSPHSLVPAWSGVLRHGTELVAHTGGRSELLVGEP